MRWSWKVGQIGGTAVHVHATFGILLVWVAVSVWTEEPTVAAVLSGLTFILSLFVCVTLHEFGHALTAKRFGIRTRDITLLPIGGLARAERIPTDPRQELAIALAGPVVTLIIAAALFLALRLSGAWEPVTQLTMTSGPFVERLMLVNLGLAAFNMLPAFPMDGGRVLRALLALRLSYMRATVAAARLGQALALGFGILGLLANPVLVFIALFVWIGAAHEAAIAQMSAVLAGVPVRHLMRTEFHTLSPAHSLEQAADLLVHSGQQAFPILERDRVAGLLTKADIVRGLTRHGEDAPIAASMQREVATVETAEMLDEAFQRLQSSSSSVAVVMDRGRVVGLLGLDMLADFVQLQVARTSLKNGRAVGARDPTQVWPAADSEVDGRARAISR